MANWGKCDFNQLKKLQKEINQLQGAKTERFIEDCSRELVERLLNKVINRTPEESYDESGKTIGTLKRGWTSKSEAEAKSGGKPQAAKAYIKSLPIMKTGNLYEIEIINPVRYASYVEFGHKAIDGKSWVGGKFMLTVSEQEVDAQAPIILENKIKKYLGECFSD